ncbi:MAG: hypothetical protein JSV34_05065, partial [Candidatus Omnitrophota bacterium]
FDPIIDIFMPREFLNNLRSISLGLPAFAQDTISVGEAILTKQPQPFTPLEGAQPVDEFAPPQEFMPSEETQEEVGQRKKK